MSRSVKDLRDLICVSRLTIRDSDEETFHSDEEEQIVRAFSRLTSRDGGDGFDMYRPESVMYARAPHESRSPDSGIGTNGQSPEMDGSVVQSESSIAPHPPSDIKRSGASRRKRKKVSKSVDTLPTMHELPRAAPLPPVPSNPFSSQARPTSPSTTSDEDETSHPITDSNPSSASSLHSRGVGSQARTNYDQILTYMDATLVSEWLGTANENVSEMSAWIHSSDNFVQFTHFWLTEFPHLQRQEIFHLEYSIIIDHLNIGFASGRSAGSVLHRDILQFLEAVFKEYPSAIMSSKGPHLFLNYLDILTSEKHSQYKRLLADVRCSTRVKQYAQWTLAVRAFCLVNTWTAIVNFYRRIIADSRQTLPSSVSTMNKADPNVDRIYHAIRTGYVDVVHYLLASGKVSARSRDSQGRTLIFTAVMHNQPQILNFLLRKVNPRPDVNLAADNGNSPLHAAANNGDVLLVTTLLRADGINVNPTNTQCEAATPLHLAVMHGHVHVVEVLLVAGADREMRMGHLSVLDMARDFGHDDVLKVLQTDGVEV